MRGSTETWLSLRSVVDRGVSADSDSPAAASHTNAAREEAARKLIHNHARVRADTCNPSTELTFDSLRSLTQRDLPRLTPNASPAVDTFLIEVARRLLGASYDLEPLLDLSTPEQANAWVGADRYISARLQSSAEQCPGREPDMSGAAASAMTAVMAEVAEYASTWLELRRMLGGASGANDAEGAAAAHSWEARVEACRKLVVNHARVRRDIANPSPNRGVNGGALTQRRTLRRVPVENSDYIDSFLREVAVRLVGRYAAHFTASRPAPAPPSPHLLPTLISTCTSVAQRLALHTPACAVTGARRAPGSLYAPTPSPRTKQTRGSPPPSTSTSASSPLLSSPLAASPICRQRRRRR